MAKVAGSVDCVREIQRFEAMEGRENVLLSCELSLKGVAAGLICCGRFCEILSRQPMRQFRRGPSILQWAIPALPAALRRGPFFAGVWLKLGNESCDTSGQRMGQRRR